MMYLTMMLRAAEKFAFIMFSFFFLWEYIFVMETKAKC